jgi:hypothetical protein
MSEDMLHETGRRPPNFEELRAALQEQIQAEGNPDVEPPVINFQVEPAGMPEDADDYL